ncbi:MAG: sulfurtransferase [Desulfobacula sp.]|nr:sulfurtransferase [Desulfobacula sp.]
MKSKYLFIIAVLALISSFVMAPFATATVDNSQQNHRYFIQASALAETLAVPNIKIIDCRRKIEDYQKGHIPGAIYLNVLKNLRVASHDGVAGVRRSPEEQEAFFGHELGLKNSDMIVLYDATGMDATRLLWELTVAGHEKVAILYGGWNEWEELNLPQETKIPEIIPQTFIGSYNGDAVASANYVLTNISNPDVVLADCRPPAQFLGKEKHPKAKLAGHIPGAVNISALMSWENKTYPKSPDELTAMFEDLGITPDKTIVVYCNTGYFGANSWFILKVLGYPDVRCYDYSWCEWSSKDYLPKVQ